MMRSSAEAEVSHLTLDLPYWVSKTFKSGPIISLIDKVARNDPNYKNSLYLIE